VSDVAVVEGARVAGGQVQGGHGKVGQVLIETHS